MFISKEFLDEILAGMVNACNEDDPSLLLGHIVDLRNYLDENTKFGLRVRYDRGKIQMIKFLRDIFPERDRPGLYETKHFADTCENGFRTAILFHSRADMDQFMILHGDNIRSKEATGMFFVETIESEVSDFNYMFSTVPKFWSPE